MACIPCNQTYHVECESINNDGQCCCITSNDADPPVAEEEDDEDDLNWRKKVGNRGKRDASLKDQQSTGRKRAARLFPLDRQAPCEWRGLQYAGGSRFPIIGCLNGLQEARHHGPDKNTLNNDEGNVHRICAKCHNRWHTRNDDGYEWNGVHTPHNSTARATDEELVKNEFEWLKIPTITAKD